MVSVFPWLGFSLHPISSIRAPARRSGLFLPLLCQNLLRTVWSFFARADVGTAFPSWADCPLGLGVANPAMKQGHKPFNGTRCHFWKMWSSKAVSRPQSWVSLVVLSSKPTARATDHSDKGSRPNSSSRAHSCEQTPPVGAEASSCSP